MSNLLVTGGAGFIGSNFVHYWLRNRARDRVVVLDALTYAGNRRSLAAAEHDPRYRFVHADICDAAEVAAVMAAERIDCVVHFAAESHVDRSIADAAAFVRTNVAGTHVLLEAARTAWTARGRLRADVRFHHVSTDEVFGPLTADAAPSSESSVYRPSSPYAATKAGADHLVRSYFRTYGLPVTISNCSNNYGPHQHPEKLIPLVVLNALHGKLLPVYGRGENVRDWLHVEDHCRAIDAILRGGKVGETYNVSGRNQWRNVDTVQLLCSILEARFAADRSLSARFPACPASRGQRVSSLLAFVADRAGHDERYALDSSKIENALGFVPAQTFESGLASTVEWYLANESWWHDVATGGQRNAGA